MDTDIIKFYVLHNPAGDWSVIRNGFDKPIAAFAHADTARQYALQLAETKPAWKVDVFDANGRLTATFIP